MKIISLLFLLVEVVYAFSVGTSLSIMDNKMLRARFNQHLSPKISYSQKVSFSDGFKMKSRKRGNRFNQLRRKIKKSIR
jgi:hypothetical protein